MRRYGAAYDQGFVVESTVELAAPSREYLLAAAGHRRFDPAPKMAAGPGPGLAAILVRGSRSRAQACIGCAWAWSGPALVPPARLALPIMCSQWF